MKKTLTLIGFAVLSVSMMMTGCASTKAEGNTVSKDIRASATENNTSYQARKTVIVDWQDRTIGAKVNPEWLLSMKNGNGTKYVSMYGLSNQYANHKWFVSSAQNRVLTNAQTEAETEVLQRLGQEMANTINSTIGTNLNDGQKAAIRTICSKVNNVTLSGVGERGTYWQLEKTEDEYGNTQNLYNFYACYSCSVETYNNLLNIYLIDLLKSKDLDDASVNEIKKHAQEILNDAQERSARTEEAKKREWINELNYEETKKFMAREETLREQSENFAKAASNASPFTSLNMENAGNPLMNPALAALINSEINN